MAKACACLCRQCCHWRLRVKKEPLINDAVMTAKRVLRMRNFSHVTWMYNVLLDK